MAKPTSSGIPSPPKPRKLTLPIQSPPKPRSLKQSKPPARPYQPKPAKLSQPKLRARPSTPKPPSFDFPKPHTSDSLTVIPQAGIAGKPAAARAAAIKTVLWISAYPALRETTKLMIEAEGFEFHSASDFLQVEAACQIDRFQLAVVDPTLTPKTKRAIGAVIREKRPSTLILELCQVSSEIPGADYVQVGHDPVELMRMVKRIARERSA